MFQRILVPIDGSPTSTAGLRQAIALAEDRGATLCLLHVVDVLLVMRGFDGMIFVTPKEVDAVVDGLRKQGKRVLDKAVEAVKRRSVKCEASLVDALGRSVADVIAEQAKKRRAGLIVMGTHGRRGVSRFVMGSDAEGVVRAARVPVMLVQHHSKPGRARVKKS